MGAAGRTKNKVDASNQPAGPSSPNGANAKTIMNLQSWSDHALHLVHSTATMVGVISAAVVLICLVFLYLSGTELTGRLQTKSGAVNANGLTMFAREDNTQGEKNARESAIASAHVSRLETDLAAARRAEEAKTSKLAQLEGKLSEAQHTTETKASQLAQLEGELDAAQRAAEVKNIKVAQLEKTLIEAKHSGEAKASQLAQMEAELGNIRQAAEQKTQRLSALEADLKTARTSADQAQAETKRIESTQGPRSITPQQRTQFLDSIRGMATGKVLVSAFFENKETHEFGAELLTLLKEAGFDAVERAPVNFFTTSRPSGGIRMGCQDIMHAPAHFATVRKGFEAIGLDVPNTSIVNAEENDVVEIQITPRQ
jgi:Tfp pilus assembly protein FimV